MSDFKYAEILPCAGCGEVCMINELNRDGHCENCEYVKDAKLDNLTDEE